MSGGKNSSKRSSSDHENLTDQEKSKCDCRFPNNFTKINQLKKKSRRIPPTPQPLALCWLSQSSDAFVVVEWFTKSC